MSTGRNSSEAVGGAQGSPALQTTPNGADTGGAVGDWSGRRRGSSVGAR
uniref:Uncharacterized protein n=1 Tax=Arundo donax TaxID=35708 RepID=A0A0A8XUZ9_ARUDO